MADNYDLQNQNVSLHPLNNTETFLYPRGVKSLSFGYNLVINSNGQQFEGYTWDSIDSPVGGGYTVKQFRYSSDSSVVYDLSTIRNYMKFMTGTDYVPVYNANEPNDMFIYLSAQQYNDNERVWKYQYDPSYGLVVFMVTNFPFALKNQVKVFPKTINVSGYGDSEYQRIYFDIYDDNLSEVKAVSVRIDLEENNKDNWGYYYAETMRGTTIFNAGEGILQNVNCRFDSFEGSQASFELLLDSSNPEVNVNDLNFANAVITLY